MSAVDWDGVPPHAGTSGLHWLSLLEEDTLWTVAMWDAEYRTWSFIGSDQPLEPDDVSLFHGYEQACEAPKHD